MSPLSQVNLALVQKMVTHCAPGSIWKEKKHHHWVQWRDRIYTAIPLGPHGRRAKVTVYAGHVRSMVRYLQIDPECAARFIPVND